MNPSRTERRMLTTRTWNFLSVRAAATSSLSMARDAVLFDTWY
jgi:hypothetical protein